MGRRIDQSRQHMREPNTPVREDEIACLTNAKLVRRHESSRPEVVEVPLTVLSLLRNRIPAVIWIVLFGLSVLGFAAVGYQAAIRATRRSPAMLALIVAFSGMVLLIADLDRVREGLIRISQQSLLDLQKTMRSLSYEPPEGHAEAAKEMTSYPRLP